MNRSAEKINVHTSTNTSGIEVLKLNEQSFADISIIY